MVAVVSVKIINSNVREVLNTNSSKILNGKYKNTAIVQVINEYENLLFSTNEFNSPEWDFKKQGKFINATSCIIPADFLNEGKYSINIAIGNYNPNMIHLKLDEVLTFRVLDDMDYKTGVKREFVGYWPGLIRPKLEWSINSYGYAE